MWHPGDQYEPVKAGSIDGTDDVPHDKGIRRAQKAVEQKKYDSSKDSKIKGDPYCTLFIARLDKSTTEKALDQIFTRWGEIKRLRIARDIVTGASRGYAFVEFYNEMDMRDAFRSAHRMVIDGRQIMIDFERERVMKTWIPRRYGGGFGGRKESGQLRFGGRDRPFKKPINVPRLSGEKMQRQQLLQTFGL